jgi:hypothetical protein
LYGSALGGTYSGTYDLGIPGHPANQVGLSVEGDWVFNVNGLDGHASGGPYGVHIMADGGYGTWNTGNAVAGKGYGSGASGPFGAFSSSAKNGAAGSAGICVIRLIF